MNFHLTYNRPTSGLVLSLSLKNNLQQSFSIEVYKVEKKKRKTKIKSVLNAQEKLYN